MHVRKGDQVVVIAGKEKGKRGRVLRLLTGDGCVLGLSDAGAHIGQRAQVTASHAEEILQQTDIPVVIEP